MNSEQAPVEFGAKHGLSVATILSLVLFSVFAAVDLDLANTITVAARDAVTGYFDWLLTGMVSIVLLLAIALVFHPKSSKRIGKDDEVPEFSRWSWFAMLFSAGLASGLVYWGAAEPITHFGTNPFVSDSASSLEAATTAVTITIFHWGLHGWGLYVVAGLAIALAAYRHDNPLAFSSAFRPLLSRTQLEGPTGRAIDILAIYGTVFGVATSIGLAVASMNAAIEPLIGIPMNVYSQLTIVMVVCTLGVLSVLSGVAKGIRRLSEVNVWLSLLLLLSIFAMGPSMWLLNFLPSNFFDYATSAIPMGFWVADSAAGQAWQTSWTVFYWGWWLAWTPFVAMFIARISKGRTVREFICGVLLVPALVVVVWMTVFGGTALHQELNIAGSVSEAVSKDYSLGLVATIENLVSGQTRIFLLAVVAFLLFTWLITSLDSATLVICHILRFDHLGGMKIMWGFLLGGVTCTLMLIGGIQALQAASIIIGLPIALLMVGICLSAIRLVITDSAIPTTD